MSVRRTITEYDGLYFITFTYSRWLKLFEITNGYDVVYKWFDHLKSKGHFITGYVIMPNHVHALIAFSNTQGQSINSIIGNGKRFMAYEIVKSLNEQEQTELLQQLASYVNDTDSRRGKLHEIFEPSFDWKECTSDKFIEQKQNYIHENPCRGEWNLAGHPQDYLHSSARYYLTGEHGAYEVLNYSELEDIDLTRANARIDRRRRVPETGDSARTKRLNFHRPSIAFFVFPINKKSLVKPLSLNSL